MIHLPPFGATVRIFPAPGHGVFDQLPEGESAGTLLPVEGREVRFDTRRYEQYVRGEIHFHDPRHVGCADCETSHMPEAKCDNGALDAAKVKREVLAAAAKAAAVPAELPAVAAPHEVAATAPVVEAK